MDDKIIEEFLQQHKIEVADNGFTERVMQALPEAEWQHEVVLKREKIISTIWTLVCIIAAIAFCVYTNVLNTIIIDITAFVHTFTLDASSIKILVLIALIPTVAAMLTAREAYNKLILGN